MNTKKYLEGRILLVLYMIPAAHRVRARAERHLRVFEHLHVVVRGTCLEASVRNKVKELSRRIQLCESMAYDLSNQRDSVVDDVKKRSGIIFDFDLVTSMSMVQKLLAPITDRRTSQVCPDAQQEVLFAIIEGSPSEAELSERFETYLIKQSRHG